MCLVKTLYTVLLVVTSISLQYNSTVTAYTVRFLSDCNPVKVVTNTTCTTDIDTVHSPDTTHIQNSENWT